jgi:hypothetical protein
VAELLAETDARVEVKRVKRRRLAEQFPMRQNHKLAVAVSALLPVSSGTNFRQWRRQLSLP